MRNLKVLLAVLGAAGMLMLPAVVQGQPATQAEILSRFVHQMALKDQARRIKMEMADAEAKLGATIVLDSDRAELQGLLGDDRDRLMGIRSALVDGLRFLRDNWDQLTSGEKFEVQEEEYSPE